MLKRILSLIFALMLLCSMSLSAFAETIDMDKLGSISVTMTYKGEAVPGGTLTVFRVADVAHDSGDYSFAYTPDFAECTVPVTQLNTAEIGAALAKIAADKGIVGSTRTLDSKGQTSFSNLKPGLYLFVQQRAAYGYSPVAPFLVSLPGVSNGKYVYDVDASPKVNVELAPTPTPTPPPSGYLPQSGLVNWPVPVLAVLGLFMVVSGLCLKVSQRKKKYEE